MPANSNIKNIPKNTIILNDQNTMFTGGTREALSLMNPYPKYLMLAWSVLSYFDAFIILLAFLAIRNESKAVMAMLPLCIFSLADKAVSPFGVTYPPSRILFIPGTYPLKL